MFYGQFIANSAHKGDVWVATSQWTAIQSGSTPLAGRKWLQFQVKGAAAVCLQYVNKNADGTFTTPTDTVKKYMIYPANSIVSLPVGENIAVYGKAKAKAGTTHTGSRVILTEFK